MFKFLFLGLGRLTFVSAIHIPSLANCLSHLNLQSSFIFIFLRRSLAVTVSAHCNLHPPGSRGSPASASQVDGFRDACHHASQIFVILVETGFPHVGQDALELLASGDPLTSASQRDFRHQSPFCRDRLRLVSNSKVQATLPPLPPVAGSTDRHQHAPIRF